MRKGRQGLCKEIINNTRACLNYTNPDGINNIITKIFYILTLLRKVKAPNNRHFYRLLVTEQFNRSNRLFRLITGNNAAL